jgi:ABC-type glycerol-3-phosphate transport system substrate-binding protein
MIGCRVGPTLAGTPYGPDRAEWVLYYAYFATAARRMSRFEGDRVTQIGYNCPSDQQFLNWVHSNGGDLFTPDFRTAIINSQPAVEALTFLTELLQAVKPPSFSSVPVDFINRTVALKEEEPTFFGNLQQRAPEQISDFAVGPPPRRVKHVVRVYVPNLAIGSQTKQPDLAWKWIEYLSRSENVVTYNSLLGRLSPRLSHLSHRYLREIPQRAEILQIYSQYGIPHAAWPPQEFALMRTVLQQNLTRAYDGTISPQQALNEVARSWQVELDKIYGSK